MSRATAIVVALVAMSAPAAAQPDDGRCEVRFVRAPDDVRHVIETWLAAEPRCRGSIDLRVIPTEEGFYLLAQRPDGRIHERLVPDAQSAGVLVASWVADDWVGPRADVWSAARPASSKPIVAPGSTTPSEALSVVLAPAPRAKSRSPRWLTLGAMFDTSDGDRDGGLRAELDLLASGSLTLGVSVAWTETSTPMQTSYGHGELRSSDVAGTLYGAYTLRTDRWELRGAVGLGGVYSDVRGGIYDDYTSGSPTWDGMSYVSGTGAGITANASLMATLRIGERWGLSTGLVGHMIHERVPTTMDVDLQRVDARLFFFTGLRRRF